MSSVLSFYALTLRAFVQIYEIVTGTSLFRGVGMTALPSHISTMVGSISQEWYSWNPKLDTSPRHVDAWWTSRREELRQGCVDDQDTDALVRLLKTVLTLDPTIRATIAEVLQDPWFHC